MTQRIYIFDTTLRDGEQAPGISLNQREKVEIAEQLARLEVDAIEAGFPVSSPSEFEAVKSIAKNVKGPVICALSRTDRNDIDWAWEALMFAERPLIHTFISTSEYHMKYQLKKTPKQVLEMARDAVAYARKYTENVEFSAMDATRSDPKFLYEVYAAAIKAGATVINVPDTVGYAVPDEFAVLVEGIMNNVPGIEDVMVSVHCHNDLGLAVANSLAAARVGARQIECAINGLGERAGNCSLEEIVMIINTRKDATDLTTGINTREIYQASRLVSMLTGYNVQPNKAVVGDNAFAHESGIHQDGVLKHRETYEIMQPEDVGLVESEIYLGKHSGRHALKTKLEEMGFYLDDNGLERAFIRFKELAGKKKEVAVKDLEAIALDEIRTLEELFQLEYMQSSSGTGAIPIAAVKLSRENKGFEATSTGDGQVDAVCRAILKAAKVRAKLKAYQVQAITKGLDAMGDVTVKLDIEGHEVVGRGVSPDIIEASARAYVNAINRAVQKGLMEKKKLARQARSTSAAKKPAAKKPAAKKPAAKKPAAKRPRK
ncbi:MAG: 2-isopropylmalate synthase [Actinobacteria bacterium]|jgi:2-isopropylmalate synthase|nr:MAG: 2-isopropylmalate synthase [Actinomycetota bacterium]